MTAAIYTRYSTDRQSESSLADQERVCRLRADAQGWIVAAVHGDDCVSGSTPVEARPGGRALLADALAARFDVLLVEGLDRLSRDLVESERVVRRLEHRGLRIVGVADGYDSQAQGRKLMRGMRGLINEVYLDDLREKTHRGLAGKVSRGFHAGGISYGYRSVPAEGGYRLEIDEDAARWVRWCFERYGIDGWSVMKITYELNRLGVTSPRGGTWAKSALYGSPGKGSGMLNNELYRGRMIWNRSQWIKDPDTGRRTRRDRPEHEWQVHEAPELRIVPDELWHQVRARLDPRNPASQRHRTPPRTLLGGLMRCSLCGGPVVAVDARRYGCSVRAERGPTVCPGVAVLRSDAETRLLSLVRDELASPAALAELHRQVAELEQQRSRGARAAVQQATRRVAELDREITHLVDAIATVGLSSSLQARLQAAEQERQTLADGLGPQAETPTRVRAGEVLAAYRRKLMDLQGALSRDTARARALLAELLGPVTIMADGDQVWAELETAEPARLASAGSPMVLVAGARFELATFGL